ncbi:Ig-like domain-containing protein, partial [Sinomicrobium sp. M5D2P9]
VDVLWGTGGDIASTANFVRDVANAFDGDDTTFAHLRANLAVLSEGVHITALYPTLSVEGDGVRVLLQREEGGLIDASVLSDNIRIRTYNNNDANSELTLDPELIQLSLFPGTTDVYELIYPVNVPFNRIEVSFDSGLASAFEGLHVYELDRAQDVPGGEFPESGLWATLQTNGTVAPCLLCDVIDPDNAVDANLTTFSQLNIPVGVGGSVWQELSGFPFRAQQGDHIQVVLGIGSGIIDASLLGGLTFQAMDGDTNAGEPIGLSNLLSVNLLPGTSDQYAFVFNPDAEFDKVRVEFQSLLAALTNIQIYGARIKLPDPDIVSGNITMPGTSTTVELSPNGGTTLEWFADAEGGEPIATGNSFTTPTLDENITYYIEISRDGFVDPQRFPVTVNATNDTWALAQDWSVFGGCLICNVTNPDNAADGDPTTYAVLNQTAGVAGGIQMNLFDFPLQGLLGDNIQLVVGLGGGIIDASLFDGLTLQSFNGENANDDLTDDAALLNLQLLPGSTDQYVVTFTPGADFDRLQLNSSALVDLFSNLRVYGARIQFVKPNIVSGLVTTPGTSTTVVAEPVAETSLAWYAAEEGGAPIATGNELTTPELTENTTYYVEVSRDGFVEPERYPVTVMVMDAPVAGIPMVRVYADGQDFGGTELLGAPLYTMSNEENAADDDKDSYSTMGITALGEVWQKLDFTTQQPGPDDPVHVKVGTETGLLSLATGLTLQTYNGDTPVGEAIQLSSLIGLLNGADQADIVLPAPGEPYNSVRIRYNGIALGGGINIYGAYFNEPGDNVACDEPSDILWGNSGGIAGGLNPVDDPENAADGDETTFAHLRVNLGVANAKTHVTTLYQMVSTPGDSIRLVFRNEGGLLDVGLLASSFTIRTYLDNQDNGALDLDESILKLSLLPGSGDLQVLTYPIDTEFNRIQVSLGEGLALALSSLYVYEIGRVAPSPVIAGGSDVTACVGEDVTLEIDFPTENVVYNWYDAETGGNLVGSGNPFTIEAANLELGTNTFYVSLSKNGCTDEASARTEVSVNVLESPEAPQAVSANVWAAPGGSATLQVLDPDENLTYNWYDAAADGELLHTGDTFEVSGVTADTSYYIEAVAGESCISPARTEVTVMVLMPPVIDPIGATITQGETVTFDGSSPDGTEVVWYDPDGNEVAVGPEFTIPDNLLPGDYVYTATTRDPETGAESDPVEIPVTVEPLVLDAPTVTPPSAVIDEGDTQTFTATHDVPGVTFTWYDPDGNVVATTPEFTTPADLPVGDYTYTVTATDPVTGVVSPPAEVPVTIQSLGGGLLPPAVNPPSAVIAEGDTETFTASHDNPDVTYTWYDGDGNEVATTPEFTTPNDLPIGAYVYTVTATDPDSGEVSDPTEVPVTVEPAGTLLPPTVTPPSATYPEGDTETFTAGHDNPDVTFTWYDPDGNEVGTTPQFTTPADLPVGNHTYTVTATDPNSGEVSDPTEVPVTVEPASTLAPPTVTPESAVLNEGDTETFTAGHDNPDVTFTWYDPDGNEVATTPEFTTPADLPVGEHTYTVTATDPNTGEVSDPTEVPVTVIGAGDLLPPTVTPPSATYPEGDTETFTASHDNPDVTFTWYDPDGNEVATTPEFTTPADLPLGDHTYTVTATDPNTGEESIPTEVPVTVEPASGLASPTVTPPAATIEEGETETFTATHPDDPDVTYTWYDPDGNEVATTPEFTTPDNLPVGEHVYTVTVTDPDTGEVSDPTEVVVTVEPSTGTLLPPTVTPPSATVMVGDTETFTASHDNPDVTYTWYDPDDNIVATTPEFTIPDDLAVGDYTYTVTVTDPDSGEESAPTEVPVSVVPTGTLLPPTVTPPAATIEEGETETFTASHDNPDVTYIWYDPDGNEVATTPEFTTPDDLPVGEHVYTVTVTDPDSGEVSDPTEVVVTVEPASGELLPPTVDPLQATINEGETALFTASTDYPNGIIVWYDTDGNEVNIGEEFVAGVGLPEGTYNYNVVVRDPDTNEESAPVQITLNILSVTPPIECLPAYDRLYATSETSSAFGVQNNVNAIDGNLDTHSTVAVPLLLISSNYQQLNFGQQFNVANGDELHVKIGTSVLLALGSIRIDVQAYNGSDAVGTPVQLSSGVLLNLLSGENVLDIVVPDPGTTFNAVRVTARTLLASVGGSVDIYEAYVNQQVETLAECKPVEDILTGSTSGALGTLNGVENENNAVDGNIETAATLRQNVGVAGYVHLTTLYSAPSVPGDSIRVVLADEDAGLLDLGVATGIKMVAYMGNTPVHEVSVQEGLLSLKLLGGSNQYEVATAVDQPFDRISIQLGGLVSALSGVNIYEIERVPGIQLEGNNPGDNVVEACQGGTVNLTAPADDCTTYVWYDARNGGNVIGEGNLEFEVPADWTPGEHIVYVQPVRYGCEESGRIAVTIQVNEAPTADDIALETDNPDYCEEEDVLITATAEEIANPVFAWYTDVNKENPVADADGVTFVVNNGELSISGLAVGTHTYYVSVKDGEDGCENVAGDLAEVSVIVKPGATAADIQTSDQVICFGETAVLEAASTTITAPVFNWYDNEDLIGDPVFTGPVFEQNGLTAGLYTYYITVQNDDTCESSAEEAVAATIAVQHQITAEDIELPGDLSQCLGSPVALSAAVNSAITVENPVFTWYLDAAGTQQITDGMELDGATYTVNGSDMTVEGLAEGTVINYYVTLDGDNVCGSLDGDLATVQVTIGNELEAPEVSESNVMVCEGEDAVLSILNPQGNLEYNWYETASGGTPVFTGSNFELTAVTGDAVYYVEAVGDGDCVSLTRTEVTVTVKDYASAADINIDGITEICEYDDLVLTPTTDITEPVFRWYANADKTGEIVDGVSADGILTLSGLAEGTYTYYVSVESDELCENPAGDLAEVEVTVGAPQAAPVVTPPEQFVVVGDDANPFEVTDPGTGEVVWYTDEELTAEVFRGTSYVPATGTVGTFTYYVVIEDGACVSEITQVVLHVTDLPTPPEECYIADSQINGTTLGCVLCSVLNPTNSIDEDTENFTRLVMPAGLVSGSVYQTLIFSHTGKAGDSVLVDMGTPVGLGDINVLGAITVTLFNGATQVDQYSLNNPLLEIRLLTGGERGQVLIPASGAYDRVEIRNTAGVATLLQSVDIYGAQILQAAPELDIPDPVEVCEGEEFVVNATPAAGTVLRWYNSDDELLYTGSNFEVPSDVTGEFTYFIEVVDQASGCPSPERIAFDVIVNDGPGAGDIAVTGNEDPVCADDDVVLTPSSAQGTVFRWYADADKTQPIADGDSDGDVSYAIDAGGVLTISGLDSDSSPYTYYVSVEGANGCENPAGDLAEVSVEITPTVPGSDIAGIEIENTNGDGEVCLNVTPDVIITAALTPGSTVTNPVFHWYDEAGDMVAGGEDGVLTLAGLAPGEHTYSVGVSGDGFCETAEADRKSITFIARDDCQLINAVDDVANTPVDVPVDIDVLANDIPGEAPIDPATVMIIDAPGNGTAEVDPVTGMVTYTPAAAFEGDDTFTYTVKDENGFESNVATVTVTVGGDNGGLLAVDDTATTPMETPVVVDVLANDEAGNAPIDPTSVAIVDMPTQGTVEVDPVTGAVTYTPGPGFEGDDTFTYTMKDEDGYTSNAATVTVSVGGDNGGLLAVDDTATTPIEMPVVVDVLANDEAGNAPIDPISVAIVDMPTQGTVEVDPVTGAVTYTPGPGFE